MKLNKIFKFIALFFTFPALILTPNISMAWFKNVNSAEAELQFQEGRILYNEAFRAIYPDDDLGPNKTLASQKSYEALKKWLPLAEKGHIQAQFWVGAVYGWRDSGIFDSAKSFYWYQKSAEQGYAEAQSFVANAYYNGNGVKQDYVQAFRWYQKSAEQGNANAQGWLADMYYKGEGVTQSNIQAIKWYEKALSSGWMSYIKRIVEIHLEMGSAENVEKAIIWYKRYCYRDEITNLEKEWCDEYKYINE